MHVLQNCTSGLQSSHSNLLYSPAIWTAQIYSFFSLPSQILQRFLNLCCACSLEWNFKRFPVVGWRLSIALPKLLSFLKLSIQYRKFKFCKVCYSGSASASSHRPPPPPTISTVAPHIKSHQLDFWYWHWNWSNDLALAESQLVEGLCMSNVQAYFLNAALALNDLLYERRPCRVLLSVRPWTLLDSCLTR